MDNPRGRVIQVESSGSALLAEVEVLVESSCARCASGKGCGAGLLAGEKKRRVQALYGNPARNHPARPGGTGDFFCRYAWGRGCPGHRPVRLENQKPPAGHDCRNGHSGDWKAALRLFVDLHGSSHHNSVSPNRIIVWSRPTVNRGGDSVCNGSTSHHRKDKNRFSVRSRSRFNRHYMLCDAQRLHALLR